MFGGNLGSNNSYTSLYDGRQELSQTDTNGNLYRQLTYLPNAIAGLYGQLLKQELPQSQNEEFDATGWGENLAEKLYFHGDAQNSTIKVTGADASNSFRYGYTPLGEAYGFKHRNADEQLTRTFSSHSLNRNVVQNLYTGKYTETLTGLTHMDARWYDPSKGRFIQPDQYNHANLMLPKGAQSELMRYIGRSQGDLLRDPAQQMRYGYVSGNALRWVDPTGLVDWGMVAEGTIEFAAGLAEGLVGAAAAAVGISATAVSVAAELPTLGASTIGVVGGVTLTTAGAVAISDGASNMSSGFSQIVAGATASSTTTSGNNDNEPNQQVFRGEGEVSPTVVFASGFNSTGTNDSIFGHTIDSSNSIYVSTSKYQSVATNYALDDGKRGDGWVFQIDTNSPKVDVNASLGDNSLFWNDYEVLIYGGVPASEVVGAYPVSTSDGTGQFVPNPNYIGSCRP